MPYSESLADRIRQTLKGRRGVTEEMIHRLRDELVQLRHQLDRWQRAARFLCDLGRCGLRQLDNDRVPQMATALSFRTLLGLMPLLVVLFGLEVGDVYAWLCGAGTHDTATAVHLYCPRQGIRW